MNVFKLSVSFSLTLILISGHAFAGPKDVIPAIGVEASVSQVDAAFAKAPFSLNEEQPTALGSLDGYALGRLEQEMAEFVMNVRGLIESSRHSTAGLLDGLHSTSSPALGLNPASGLKNGTANPFGAENSSAQAAQGFRVSGLNSQGGGGAVLPNGVWSAPGEEGTIWSTDDGSETTTYVDVQYSDGSSMSIRLPEGGGIYTTQYDSKGKIVWSNEPATKTASKGEAGSGDGNGKANNKPHTENQSKPASEESDGSDEGDAEADGESSGTGAGGDGESGDEDGSADLARYTPDDVSAGGGKITSVSSGPRTHNFALAVRTVPGSSIQGYDSIWEVIDPDMSVVNPGEFFLNITVDLAQYSPGCDVSPRC